MAVIRSMTSGELMTRRRLIGLLGGAATLLLVGCGVVKSYAPFRYRLTVEVETPAGLRSGSSVIEVTAGEVRSTLGGAGVDVRGEAAAVDLPGGQTLFALLRYEDHGGWAGDAMFDVVPYPSDKSIPIDDRFGAHVQAVIADRTLHVVPRTTKNVSDKDVSAYPMLVRFGDIRDPKSVALVNPDDLAASFGAGYRLRRMTVQRTDDPVTVGIEKRLGWLATQRGGLIKSLPGRSVNDMPFGADLNEGDFETGER